MVKERLLDHLVWRVLNLPVTRLSNCVVSANVHAADDRLKTTGEARLPLTFVKTRLKRLPNRLLFVYIGGIEYFHIPDQKHCTVRS